MKREGNEFKIIAKVSLTTETLHHGISYLLFGFLPF